MILGDLSAPLARLEQIAGDDLALPAWLVDQQARSRSTRQRILEVAYDYVVRGEFDERSMQDLADDVGVSVGAVYARFPSKESILELLAVLALDSARMQFESALHDATCRGETGPEAVGAIIDAYTRTLVEQLTLHAPVLRAARRHASGSTELRALMRRTNDAIHGTFLSLAGAHADTVDLVGRDDQGAALRYGLFVVNAAAREAALAGALSVYEVDRAPATLAGELAKVFRAYLGLEVWRDRPRA